MICIRIFYGIQWISATISLPVRYDEVMTVDISPVVELLARMLVDTKGVLKIDKVVGLLDTTIVGERVFNELDPVDGISDEIGELVIVPIVGNIVVNMLVD